MKYAWIENEKIRDICQGGDPSECYHPDVAKFYDTLVPDDAVNGDGWVNNQLIKPPPVVVVPPPRTWSADDVRKNLTLLEKVKWDNNSSPEIITVKAELVVPATLETITELLELLVITNQISQQSMNKILE